MIKGYFTIRIPKDISEEFKTDIEMLDVEEIEISEVISEKKIDEKGNKLNFSIGGEEYNVIKLLFETLVTTSFKILGDILIDLIKKSINKNKINPTVVKNIELIYPDGTIVKFSN